MKPIRHTEHMKVLAVAERKNGDGWTPPNTEVGMVNAGASRAALRSNAGACDVVVVVV